MFGFKMNDKRPNEVHHQDHGHCQAGKGCTTTVTQTGQLKPHPDCADTFRLHLQRVKTQASAEPLRAAVYPWGASGFRQGVSSTACKSQQLIMGLKTHPW